MGNGRDFLIVENLYISLGHVHTNVILGLLQISSRSLKVQTIQLDVLRNLETCENGDRRLELQRGVTRVGIGIDVIFRQSTSEREVLTGSTAQVRQTAVSRRRERVALLLHILGLLLHGDIIGYRIIAAITQAPLFLCT